MVNRAGAATKPRSGKILQNLSDYYLKIYFMLHTNLDKMLINISTKACIYCVSVNLHAIDAKKYKILFGFR